MSYYPDPSQQQQQQGEPPLPYGWIKEFDQNSQSWYFVDTQSPNPTPVWNDPRSSPFPPSSNSSYSPQPSTDYTNGAGGGGGQAASYYGSAPPQSPYDPNGGASSPYPGQPGGAQEGQEEFFTDESRSATSTQDRGFGKVVLGVGAAGMAMWLAKKYFANKKQSQHQQQQSYGPPPGQQGGYVQNPWGGGPPPPGSQHQGGYNQGTPPGYGGGPQQGRW